MKRIEVVAAVIKKGDRIFATQRGYGDFKDRWEFPGGKVERGETPQEALEREIRELTLKQEDVLGVDLIHTRVFGNRIYVDIEICADGSMTLEAGHRIAERVHDVIESSFPKVKHIMVHVNPFEENDAP